MAHCSGPLRNAFSVEQFRRALTRFGVKVLSTGAIEFFGMCTTTRALVRGTVAAGSTEVVLTTATVDPAQLVVFTRIN